MNEGVIIEPNFHVINTGRYIIQSNWEGFLACHHYSLLAINGVTPRIGDFKRKRLQSRKLDAEYEIAICRIR